MAAFFDLFISSRFIRLLSKLQGDETQEGKELDPPVPYPL
jgi:hypothetical protein